MNKKKPLEGKRIGLALCGSFCTFSEAKKTALTLTEMGAILTPIFSFNAGTLNTRFGNAKSHMEEFELICKNAPFTTIEETEPVGPKAMFDLLLIAPCTGNTLAKLAVGITDTPVTMAAKSHVRNNRPVLIALATNDALSASAKNIGTLLNYRNFYFVPFSQDDFDKKPRSCISDFDKIPEAVLSALENKQYQPIILS
ncbi:MAG: dipicolinate synthase subunit B [Ruminococcus sp.]|jgi:dipicolinate synthase subunit B|nr:dipicolinate synthase subunit B [Ruminococcus sp.]